ncbi:MAG TPA: paraquat-inducible protein A [Gammaproteobacteria bacterium]|nr:paraquat-inducible protein A [Gammaproteobacteria bacterium]
MIVSKFHKLSFRNRLAFSISILAFLFLFPGIYLSMLTISTEGTVHAKLAKEQPSLLGKLAASGKTPEKKININILDTTRSILNTVHSLWMKKYFFVASLIFLFSVIIPTLKALLLTHIFFNPTRRHRELIFNFVKAIGKWSMCDVFIVATFLAYLSTGASKTENVHNVSMMGYSVNLDVLSAMHAQLQIGFWCFLSYCLLSLIALQLYEPY